MLIFGLCLNEIETNIFIIYRMYQMELNFSTQNKINFFCKVVNFPTHQHGPLWSWTYGSWIYNYLCNQCLSPVHGEVYSIQHYVIKFISDLQQIGGFLRVLFGFLHQYNCRHDIAEILLKVALNTINQTKSTQFFK
jgi:hypothetical protein